MDILTALDREADYSKTQLQFILGAWVLSTLVEKKKKISLTDGDVDEADYDKRSLYSLLYALYRSMGQVRSETGERYEFTFNTWGYAWPKAWGESPVAKTDPQRYGKNAYAGLYHFDAVKKYVAERDGKVHVVEMGCGTGAGAHLVCSKVLPKCTYEAVDMQFAAIQTCKRKFVPELGGRLVGTCSDATKLKTKDGVADFVAVNETHVTEYPGRTTDEDRKFFETAYRLLKPGGYLVWGNAIPDSTWKPCFELLESIGMKVKEQCDVTKEAVVARDEDKARIDTYVDQCVKTFFGFRIPVLGRRKREEADLALKNFARNPGTRLYENMVDGTDSYRVVLVQKPLN
jgi:ubiquinone/menaquinone biosynthesis C-methylase UbiE